jgi:MFS family permease
MTSLAILLHVEQQTGSYGAAGLVLAAASIGQATAGPVTSRWMGIWGMRRVLTLTTAVCAAACWSRLDPMGVAGYMVFGLSRASPPRPCSRRCADLPQARQRAS